MVESRRLALYDDDCFEGRFPNINDKNAHIKPHSECEHTLNPIPKNKAVDDVFTRTSITQPETLGFGLIDEAADKRTN